MNKVLLSFFLFFFVIISTVFSSTKTERVIVVDQNLIIKKIINNSDKLTIDPIVILDNSGGVELPYTESIENQYKKIIKKLNLKKNGIIYEKIESSSFSLLDAIIYLLRKLIGGEA